MTDLDLSSDELRQISVALVRYRMDLQGRDRTRLTDRQVLDQALALHAATTALAKIRGRLEG